MLSTLVVRIIRERQPLKRAIGQLLLSVVLGHAVWVIGWKVWEVSTLGLAMASVRSSVLDSGLRFIGGSVYDSLLPYVVAPLLALVRLATIAPSVAAPVAASKDREPLRVRAVLLPAAACIVAFWWWVLIYRWPEVKAPDVAVILLRSLLPLGGIVATVCLILRSASSTWWTIGKALLVLYLIYPIWMIGWGVGDWFTRWLVSKDIGIDLLESSYPFIGSLVDGWALPYTLGLTTVLVRLATMTWLAKPARDLSV